MSSQFYSWGNWGLNNLVRGIQELGLEVLMLILWYISDRFSEKFIELKKKSHKTLEISSIDDSWCC